MRRGPGARVAAAGGPAARGAAILAPGGRPALSRGRGLPRRELAGLRLDPEVQNADPALLSTGERSRLALLRLLLNGPEVLLLDEPTANLDQDNRALVIERIHRYRKERDAPVVWVSHLPEVVAAADRVLLLPAGEVRGLPDPGRAPAETPA